VSFYACNPLDKLWEPIWALGNQKLGFWGKNGDFPESITAGHCHNSPQRVGGELGANFACENSPREFCTKIV